MQENSQLDDDDSENEEFDQEVLQPQGSEELTSEENPELPSTFSSEQKKIKANQKITFQHEGQQCTSTVMSRAGKGTGRYAKWFNIQYKTPDSQAGKTGSIDLAAVENLQIIEENIPNQSKGNGMTVADKVTDEIFELQHDQFDTAKQAELQSWKDHNVYEVVPHTQQKCMSLRWVCSLKSTNDGSVKPKARLVARGFEEQTDNIEKESPTCAKDSLRVMISIINQNKWKLRSIDIKTAFLQGEAIDKNVYVRPPPEVNRGVDRTLTKDEQDILRSKIGQLLWVSNQTRPDICFDTSNLAVNIPKSTTKDISNLNKVINKLKKDSYVLTFKQLKKPVKIVVYTDAAFGNLPDGGSQGGYLVFLVDEDNQCNIIIWQSRRLKRIVRSTLAAETLAMCDGIDAALYISATYCGIVYSICSHELPIEVVTDNKSLFDALKSSKYVSDKRLRIDIGALKQLIANKDIDTIHWVRTREQLADALTKNGVFMGKLVDVVKTGQLPKLV